MSSWLGSKIGRWISNLKVPSSNPPPSHTMNLCLVVTDSTPPRFVNSPLLSLPPAGIFNKSLFHLQYLFAHFSVLSTVLLKTLTLR